MVIVLERNEFKKLSMKPPAPLPPDKKKDVRQNVKTDENILSTHNAIVYEIDENKKWAHISPDYLTLICIDCSHLQKDFTHQINVKEKKENILEFPLTPTTRLKIKDSFVRWQNENTTYGARFSTEDGALNFYHQVNEILNDTSLYAKVTKPKLKPGISTASLDLDNVPATPTPKTLTFDIEVRPSEVAQFQSSEESIVKDFLLTVCTTAGVNPTNFTLVYSDVPDILDVQLKMKDLISQKLKLIKIKDLKKHSAAAAKLSKPKKRSNAGLGSIFSRSKSTPATTSSPDLSESKLNLSESKLNYDDPMWKSFLDLANIQETEVHNTRVATVIEQFVEAHGGYIFLRQVNDIKISPQLADELNSLAGQVHALMSPEPTANQTITHSTSTERIATTLERKKRKAPQPPGQEKSNPLLNNVRKNSPAGTPSGKRRAPSIPRTVPKSPSLSSSSTHSRKSSNVGSISSGDISIPTSPLPPDVFEETKKLPSVEEDPTKVDEVRRKLSNRSSSRNSSRKTSSQSMENTKVKTDNSTRKSSSESPINNSLYSDNTSSNNEQKRTIESEKDFTLQWVNSSQEHINNEKCLEEKPPPMFIAPPPPSEPPPDEISSPVGPLSPNPEEDLLVEEQRVKCTPIHEEKNNSRTRAPENTPSTDFDVTDSAVPNVELEIIGETNVDYHPIIEASIENEIVVDEPTNINSNDVSHQKKKDKVDKRSIDAIPATQTTESTKYHTEIDSSNAKKEKETECNENTLPLPSENKIPIKIANNADANKKDINVSSDAKLVVSSETEVNTTISRNQTSESDTKPDMTQNSSPLNETNTIQRLINEIQQMKNLDPQQQQFFQLQLQLLQQQLILATGKTQISKSDVNIEDTTTPPNTPLVASTDVSPPNSALEKPLVVTSSRDDQLLVKSNSDRNENLSNKVLVADVVKPSDDRPVPNENKLIRRKSEMTSDKPNHHDKIESENVNSSITKVTLEKEQTIKGLPSSPTKPVNITSLSLTNTDEAKEEEKPTQNNDKRKESTSHSSEVTKKYGFQINPSEEKSIEYSSYRHPEPDKKQELYNKLELNSKPDTSKLESDNKPNISDNKPKQSLSETDKSSKHEEISDNIVKNETNDSSNVSDDSVGRKNSVSTPNLAKRPPSGLYAKLKAKTANSKTPVTKTSSTGDTPDTLNVTPSITNNINNEIKINNETPVQKQNNEIPTQKQNNNEIPAQKQNNNEIPTQKQNNNEIPPQKQIDNEITCKVDSERKTEKEDIEKETTRSNSHEISATQHENLSQRNSYNPNGVVVFPDEISRKEKAKSDQEVFQNYKEILASARKKSAGSRSSSFVFHREIKNAPNESTSIAGNSHRNEQVESAISSSRNLVTSNNAFAKGEQTNTLSSNSKNVRQDTVSPREQLIRNIAEFGSPSTNNNSSDNESKEKTPVEKPKNEKPATPFKKEFLASVPAQAVSKETFCDKKPPPLVRPKPQHQMSLKTGHSNGTANGHVVGNSQHTYTRSFSTSHVKKQPPKVLKKPVIMKKSLDTALDSGSIEESNIKPSQLFRSSQTLPRPTHKTPDKVVDLRPSTPP